MSNKRLTFEQAFRSGKDFRCVDSGVCFTQKDYFIYSEHLESGKLYFRGQWLDCAFELIEKKIEITESQFDDFINQCDSLIGGHVDVSELKQKLGF